jgi:hypothetical protein
MVLWVARKNGFTILSVFVRVRTHAVFVRWQPRAGCRTAPLQFFKAWDLEGWPYLCFHQFSQCASICFIYLDILIFHNSNLNHGYIKYTLNSLEENTYRCGTSETMSYLSAPSTWNSRRTRSNLPRFEVESTKRGSSYYCVKTFFYHPGYPICIQIMIP